MCKSVKSLKNISSEKNEIVHTKKGRKFCNIFQIDIFGEIFENLFSPACRSRQWGEAVAVLFGPEIVIFTIRS